jgi:glycosyltransferase involved in cell wall biosynthesis
MISFIIIGKNEGWKLTRCLQSVFETIEYNKLEDAEVIYVDSKSTDDSIERAKVFEKVNVFLITGECNAAIARNIGAKEASGDILFFIDGDMEIEKDFIKYAIIDGKLKHACLSGHIDDYLYDVNDNFLDVKQRTYKNNIPEKEKEINTNGGLMLIKRNVWDSLSGMRTKYKRSQDLDLCLRLRNKGFKIVRLSSFIAKHHTIDYNNDKRMWQNLKQKYSYYAAMIFRDHIFNTKALYRNFRTNYTSILLLFLVFSLLINDFTLLIFLISYAIALFLKAYVSTLHFNHSDNKGLYFFEKIFHQVFYDILFWIGFIFFHPKSKKLNYTVID